MILYGVKPLKRQHSLVVPEKKGHSVRLWHWKFASQSKSGACKKFAISAALTPFRFRFEYVTVKK